MQRGSRILEPEVLERGATAENPQEDSLWYPELLRQGRSFAALWRDEVIWPLLAVVLLLASTFLVAWTNIALVQISGPASVPIDLGWGIRIPFLSYGLFAALVMLWLLWRGLAALPWFTETRASSRVLRLRPLAPRTLFRLGAVVAAIPLLYTFQFLFVDFGRVAQLANQENESLLIRAHLGYSLPRTHLVFSAFQFDIASIGDRWALLVQVSDLGLVLAIFAALLCWVGAFRLLRARRRDAIAAGETAAVGQRSKWVLSQRHLVIGGVYLFAALILARPVAGLVFDRQAGSAQDKGYFTSALTFYNWAAALNPALQSLPSYHQDRGATLWALGNQNTLDAQLYLADQYRGLNDLNDAWTTDYALRQQYPQSQAVEQDLALTYEELIEQYNVVDTSLVDNQSAPRNPQVFTTPQDLTGAIPWLNQLIALEPNNVYARYVRGRALYRIHDYELAADDFQAILPYAGDNDMLSASYTYLALCRGGLGDYAGERILLLKAVELDNGYNNATARENASGLH